MGSATQTSSVAQTERQEQGKRVMNEAMDNGDLRRVADVGITVLLATQPNGPAKVPLYSNVKHATKFVTVANSSGVEAGVIAAGESIATSAIAGGYADAAVDSAQATVSIAAENETIQHSVTQANKNLQTPAEQATEDTLAAIMTNGADALSDKRYTNRD